MLRMAKIKKGRQRRQPYPSERPLLADSVEKVGHGFHGREVCA